MGSAERPWQDTETVLQRFAGRPRVARERYRASSPRGWARGGVPSLWGWPRAQRRGTDAVRRPAPGAGDSRGGRADPGRERVRDRCAAPGGADGGACAAGAMAKSETRRRSSARCARPKRLPVEGCSGRPATRRLSRTGGSPICGWSIWGAAGGNSAALGSGPSRCTRRPAGVRTIRNGGGEFWRRRRKPQEPQRPLVWFSDMEESGERRGSDGLEGDGRAWGRSTPSPIMQLIR